MTCLDPSLSSEREKKIIILRSNGAWEVLRRNYWDKLFWRHFFVVFNRQDVFVVNSFANYLVFLSWRPLYSSLLFHTLPYSPTLSLPSPYFPPYFSCYRHIPSNPPYPCLVFLTLRRLLYSPLSCHILPHPHAHSLSLPYPYPPFPFYILPHPRFFLILLHSPWSSISLILPSHLLPYLLTFSLTLPHPPSPWPSPNLSAHATSLQPVCNFLRLEKVE